MNSVLYIGLDGLPLEAFKQNRFPNFKRLRDAGNWGLAKPEIRSTFPSWTSINTGLTVAQHHIDGPPHRSWWWEVPGRHKFLWDYMHEVGYKCGVHVFPITYPPRKWDDGSWFVAGYPAGPEATHGLYYHPTDLEFPDGWRVDWVDHAHLDLRDPPDRPLYWGVPGNCEQTYQLMTQWEEMHAFDFLKTAPKVDFLAAQIAIVDRIGHEMVKPEAEKELRRSTTERVWAWADEAVGRLIDYQEPDVILLASDHGTNIELHTWEGVWALSGADAARSVEIPLDNWRILPTFLDLMGLLPDDWILAPSGLIRDESAIEDRLRALGYIE